MLSIEREMKREEESALQNRDIYFIADIIVGLFFFG